MGAVGGLATNVVGGYTDALFNPRQYGVRNKMESELGNGNCAAGTW